MTGTEDGNGEVRGSAEAPHIPLESSREATAAATGAAVAHVLARPDSIRHRAQNAATISSAVAAALAVASVTQITGSGGESWRPWTVVVAVLALVLWVFAVWKFVRVVTLGTRGKPEGPGYQALVNAYESYSNDLRDGLKKAAKWSAVALAVTAVAIVSEVIERTSVGNRERQLVLTQTGVSAVALLCNWREGTGTADSPINVRVSSDELLQQVVEVEVVSRPPPALEETCDGQTRDVRIPRSVILAAADSDR